MIELTRRERVVHLTINAPKVNVLDTALLNGLEQRLRACSEDGTVAAVLLRGAGRCFSAGAAVAEHTAELAPAMLEALLGACTAISESPAPVVALVHGACMGGAMELVSFCDFVVADPGATFGQPEIKLAFFPPLACCQLPRLAGAQNAAYLALTGDTVTAERAQAMGLVQLLLPEPEWARLEEAFNALSAPVVRATKAALRRAAAPADQARMRDLNAFFLSELYTLEDVAEGIASFAERRPPRWRHR